MHYNLHGHVLALPAENDVDPVIKRSVLHWDGKPRLSAHDHHILLSCSPERSKLKKTTSPKIQAVLLVMVQATTTNCQRTCHVLLRHMRSHMVVGLVE